MGNITFISENCGNGKTTRAIDGLEYRKSYIIITPFIEEIKRWKNTAKVPLQAALDEELESGESKSEWLRRQIDDQASIVCTHALWDRVNVDDLDLSNYEIICDEAFEVIDAVHGITESAFDRVYLADGWATVDPVSGKVSPTEKWMANPEKVAPTIRLDLFHRAKQGSLFKVPEKGFFISLVPKEVFCNAKCCTILTYLAEDSIMAGYFRKLGIPFTIERKDDKAFRDSLKQRLTVKQISALEVVHMSYNKQEAMKAAGAKKVSNALMNLRGRELVGVPQENIILSCNKEKWSDGKTDKNGKLKGNGPFAQDSTLAKVNWLPRTVRATNDYRHCSHAVYLNDLRLNPSISAWLGWTKDDEDKWAISELIQWVMRSRLRDGEDVSLYLASGRMKALLEDYLENKKEDEAVILLAA